MISIPLFTSKTADQSIILVGGYQTFGDMRTIMVRFNGPRRIGCIYVECIEMGADAFHRPEVLDYPCCGLEHATFGVT
ncbi:hypothetical protein TMatcc_003098 [Talaromyces marneffei ATCC 18224]